MTVIMPTLIDTLARSPRRPLFFLCSVTLLFISWSGWYPWVRPMQAVLSSTLRNAIPWDYPINSTQEKEPLIFLYNSFFSSPNWNTNWDSVNGSSFLRTLTDCPIKCQFTSSPYLLQSADMVLVSLLAYYKGYGGKPV